MKSFTQVTYLLVLAFVSMAHAADSPEAISKTTTSLNAKFIVATPANPDTAELPPLPIRIVPVGTFTENVQRATSCGSA